MRAVSGPSPFGRAQGRLFDPLPDEARGRYTARPTPSSPLPANRCHLAMPQYLLCFSLPLSPTGSPRSAGLLTKMHSPRGPNFTSLIVSRPALSNLFLHSLWTSDDEMEEKEYVNQIRKSRFSILEQCFQPFARHMPSLRLNRAGSEYSALTPGAPASCTRAAASMALPAARCRSWTIQSGPRNSVLCFHRRNRFHSAISCSWKSTWSSKKFARRRGYSEG